MTSKLQDLNIPGDMYLLSIFFDNLIRRLWIIKGYNNERLDGGIRKMIYMNQPNCTHQLKHLDH